MQAFTRRRLLQLMAVGGAAIATPLGAVSEVFRAHAQSCSHGELYAGFILLGQNDPLPSCVQPPQLQAPSMCGIGEPGEPWSAPTAVTEELGTASALAAIADYAVYELGALPNGLVLDGVALVKQPTGEHYEATLRYRAYDPALGDWFTAVSVTANPDTHEPYPLWTHAPEQEGDEDVTLIKVNYTPKPGIFVAMPGQVTDQCDMCDYKFTWVDDGVLYTLSDQYSQSFAAAVALASSVVLVP